jgi:hypothetical protein
VPVKKRLESLLIKYMHFLRDIRNLLERQKHYRRQQWIGQKLLMTFIKIAFYF